jgi:copper homeostasis protein
VDDLPTKKGKVSCPPMIDCHFELCAERLESAQAAEAGGADRVELCSELSIGGLTPSFDLVRAVVKSVSIPVHVLIRPRGGNFTPTEAEFAQMRRQVEMAKQAGAAGVVLGILHTDCRVDIERTSVLVDEAYPMSVTFHRAFDESPDLCASLEAVLRTGVNCLLTSGGAPNVLAGADTIRRLREQAACRLNLIAGGGLTLETIPEVARRTGVSYLHGSLTKKRVIDEGVTDTVSGRAELENDVREAVRLFRSIAATRDNSTPASY